MQKTGSAETYCSCIEDIEDSLNDDQVSIDEFRKIANDSMLRKLFDESDLLAKLARKFESHTTTSGATQILEMASIALGKK